MTWIDLNPLGRINALKTQAVTLRRKKLSVGSIGFRASQVAK
ncbi:hypothetical protein [Dyella silvatica]|nr:hypothetical protein [Dyella silvatica]